MSQFNVRKVAVLGAGVMGAQIAAHLVNVKVPVVLFDLPAKEGPKNGIVTRAVENLKKMKPAPLGVAEDAALIQQANYEEHLEELRGCDLIIEAIAERLDWKEDLYKKIAPFVNDRAISNLEAASGKRVAAFDHDKAQAQLISRVGARPVAADVMNFGTMFNNGNVDVVMAPSIAFKPLELHKGMPVGSGLGSSAASVVAAVLACDEHYGNRLGERARIKLMGELEARLSGGIHWDNILPCALGGLRLGASCLPVPAGWIWLVAYPGIRLETRAMRAVLPESVPLHDAVEQAARLGRFVDALYRGDGREAASLMVDTMIEPYRAPSIPGFDTIKAALLAAGALSAGISGSGPTIFAVFDDPKAAGKALERARLWTSAVSGKPAGDSFSKLCGADKGAFAVLCTVDEAGARVLPPDGKPAGKE